MEVTMDFLAEPAKACAQFPTLSLPLPATALLEKPQPCWAATTRIIVPVSPRLTQGFALVRNKFCCGKPLRLFNMVAQFSLCTLKRTWSKKSWDWLCFLAYVFRSPLPIYVSNSQHCAMCPQRFIAIQINGNTFFSALLRVNWQHCKISEVYTLSFTQNL